MMIHNVVRIYFTLTFTNIFDGIKNEMSVFHKLKHILCDHLKLQVKINVMIGGRTTEIDYVFRSQILQ